MQDEAESAFNFEYKVSDTFNEKIHYPMIWLGKYQNDHKVQSGIKIKTEITRKILKI